MKKPYGLQVPILILEKAREFTKITESIKIVFAENKDLRLPDWTFINEVSDCVTRNPAMYEPRRAPLMITNGSASRTTKLE